jgi:hypothetical protein
MTTITRYHRALPGEDVYDDASLFPAPRLRTIVRGAVDNPVLADVIYGWDHVLQESGPTDQPFEVNPHRVIRVVFDNTECRVAFTLAGVLGIARAVPEEVWFSELHAEQPISPHGGAVQAVEWIADVTGLPQQDVIKASGLKKRTFHYWKNHPDASPRLGSQADLWAVVQTIESLVEDLGSEEVVAKWIKAEPRRRALFTDGAHRRLAALALDEAVQRGEYADPASVSAGRSVAVGRFIETGDDE